MKDSEESLTSQLPQLESFVTNEIISQCVLNLKAVNDIPRLYRRTNRDVSTQLHFYTLTPSTMDNTNAAVLSSGVFAISVSVTRTIKLQNPLPFYKFRQELANRDVTKEALNCTVSL